MEEISHEPLNLSIDDGAILAELLETERTKLLVEIRHTAHRTYRDSLRRRLDAVSRLLERCRAASNAE